MKRLPARLATRLRLSVGARRLRERLAVFRTVADGTYDWELWIGPAGDVRYVSPSCLRVTGRPAEAVRAEPDFFRRSIHPEDYPAWRRLMEQSLQRDVPSLDFRIRRPDGALVWLAQETTRVFGPDGSFKGLRLSLRDVTDRVSAQQALREAHERLEERVLERTAELDRANRELRTEIRRGNRTRRELERSRERFRSLSTYLQQRIEEERTRIAREIHDELGQNLTALNMGLFSLETPQARTDPQRIAALRAIVAGTVESVQRIARELRPAILDELGLAEAVAWRARTFQESSGIAVGVETGPGITGVTPEVSTALYRVFQEGLTNVARHAGATRVRVRLTRSRGRLRLEVADNGRGLDPKALDAPGSLGLTGMRERVRAVGGRMDIGAAPGGGTLLCANVPERVPRAGRRKVSP
ncbi:Oxygen sensor histidine kinase NreB [Fundidesulfovibrio magnetotacticus]|uniref:histidine kinase n=1 Tax=Fundidesulfovibrio magnetotacticus TaxID=2730080 RepID=A0A6V8LUJ8_9BACT|nr:ATP-binding protein [Fundidesulfovibrio magnetotacticus]GFK94251.1 Oxygen sensor histidine kinase NreB [Fundidesulfovibrio magnetotacticus]